MRCLPFLFAICLLAGCAAPSSPVVKLQIQSDVPVLITNLPSQSIVLTLLKSASEFDTFNTVRTNDSQRANFTNVIQVLNKHISNVDCTPTALKNELTIGGPIVMNNLNPVFNLLEYYTQVQTNCLMGLEAVKTGIELGLGK